MSCTIQIKPGDCFYEGLIKLGIVHFTPNYALINTLQTTDEAFPGREDGTCSLVPHIFPVPQCSPFPQNLLGPLFFCYPEMNALFPLCPNPLEGFSDGPPPPPNNADVEYFFCGSYMFLFCLVFAMFCARLFICALWSPAGKGLTSWLSFVVSTVSLSLSHWYPGSGVVLNCIDS